MPELRASLGWPLRLPARLWVRPGYLRGLPPDPKPRRLAILAGHWIGDTFWDSQVLPTLRARFPEAAVTIVTKPFAAALWEGLARPDELRLEPRLISDRRREPASLRGVWAAARELARERAPDAVIDLMGNRYSALFAFALRPDWCLGFGGQELAGLLSHRSRAALDPAAHLCERPWRVIAPLAGPGAAPDALRPVSPQGDPDALLERLALAGPGPLALLAPGAGWPAKEWPLARFAEAARALHDEGWRILATGSPAQRPLCEAVVTGLARASAETISIAEAVTLLERAAGVIANDSALGHFAAARGLPTLSLFTGATEPSRCQPRGPKVAVVDGRREDPADVDLARRLIELVDSGHER